MSGGWSEIGRHFATRHQRFSKLAAVQCGPCAADFLPQDPCRARLACQLSTFNLQQVTTQDRRNYDPAHTLPDTTTSGPSDKMAESGIDRKADEKIQFSTSKEVTVHPTFESMSLKGKLHHTTGLARVRVRQC